MAQAETLHLSFPESDIALLTFDAPGKGANILSSAVLDELSAHLDVVEKRDDLAGLIFISAKPGIFIAGADLREFVASIGMPAAETVKLCRRGQDLFARLSRCPFVTISAIDGICVGGGAELSVWCDRRIMSNGSKTEIGFPEVKLGLFPGWGGTVRMPRIVGLGNAVELITGGESIDAEAAELMGLASDVVAVDDLLPAAIRTVRDEQESGSYLQDRQKWSGPLSISDTELAFLGATASAVVQQQTKGQYPAPMAALETMLGAAGVDAETACQMEAEGMSHLFGTPINAALLNVFFLTDRNKKSRGVTAEDVPVRTFESVGVIGAGIMGSGIAAANIKREIPTVINDASQEALLRGARNVIEEVSFNRKTKQSDVNRAIKFAPLLSESENQAGIAHCDLVIEAVVENAELKKPDLRGTRTAVERRRHFGIEHVDDSDF